MDGELPRAQARLEKLLRVFAGLFALAALAYLVASFVRPWSDFVHHLPFVSNSVVKVTLLSLCCLFASGDVGARRDLVRVVIAAHLVSVLAMGGFLVGTDVARPSALGVSIGTVLWGAIALDGLILAVLVVAYLPVHRAPQAKRTPEPGGTARSAERRLRRFLIALVVAFVAAAVLYELGPLLSATRELFRELPFVSNSVVKVAVLAMLCGLAVRDLERNLAVIDIVLTAHVVSVVAMLAMLIGSDTSTVVAFGDGSIAVRDMLWGAIALDGVLAAVLIVLTVAAWRARFGLRYFRPVEFRALVALGDVLIAGKPGAEPVTPREIAANVDRYIVQIRARRRVMFRVALFAIQLHPLLRLRPPLSEMQPTARQRHLKERFWYGVPKPQPDVARSVLQALIRIAKQLVYVGYYGDPRTFASVGYVPFSERRRRSGVAVPKPAVVELDVTPGREVPAELTTDVCIVGSGAAGAVLAHELAKRGRDVLVIERGRFVRPAEFSEDEVEMIGKLYADGLFQQTQDFRFTILQGSSVGGTTTVNNAVCFRPPDEVLARWNDPASCDAGLDVAALGRSVEHVWRWVKVQRPDVAALNPSGERFRATVEQAFREEFQDGAPVVDANIQDCLGCGYCNIGCAYGRKLSMLDLVLPAAQRNGPGRVRIVSECRVERIRTRTGTPAHVHDLRAVVPDGRPVTIRARTYVLSAGAIASSYLMMRSGVGRGLPIGANVSFNMGSYLTAEFDETIDSHAGLQISHYARPAPDRGFVLETWWNPPVAQAINMPGWFEDHFANMQAYSRMMAVGVLVGTESNARVRRALTGGADVDYTPDPADMHKLGDGLRSVGRILFRAGARRVMANTWGYDVFEREEQLETLDRLVAPCRQGAWASRLVPRSLRPDPRYIALGTGHPQGGNAISRDPARGVVGPEFRVHGYDNLYVCDASVFPTSVTVNPQITIMSLAHYAAQRID